MGDPPRIPPASLSNSFVAPATAQAAVSDGRPKAAARAEGMSLRFGHTVHRGSLAKDAFAATMDRTPPTEIEGDRRVRGPRNRRPRLLRFGAVLHILTRLAFFCTIVGVPVAMGFEPGLLKPLLIAPATLVVCGLAWLIVASKVGCRVCAMRLFLNKRCAKSRKAPDWKPLGPHNTLAILALCSSAVRCPYCGTPNELSERNND